MGGITESTTVSIGLILASASTIIGFIIWLTKLYSMANTNKEKIKSIEETRLPKIEDNIDKLTASQQAFHYQVGSDLSAIKTKLDLLLGGDLKK